MKVSKQERYSKTASFQRPDGAKSSDKEQRNGDKHPMKASHEMFEQGLLVV